MLIKKVIKRVRALYYSFLYEIGKGCNFENLKLIGEGKETIKIGKNVAINRKTELCGKIDLPVILGDGSFINQQCLLRPNVIIGKNVAIAQKVSLISDSHIIGDMNKRAGDAVYNPIRIEDGCWIGAGAIILGNVTIGQGTVIGAGSLVNKDCEPNSLYGGVPAKFIKKLD